MTATTVHEPTHREALWELEDAFERGDLITIFGRCTVEYDGRAASSLGLGRRLLLLKPDGTALVHTDEKQKPVNWQPPGSEHHAAVRDGRLRVRSVRTSPDETLDVHFETVEQLSAMAVSGRRDLSVTGSEADLRNALLDRPAVIESGFEPLATERPTDAGPIDLFGRDTDGRPVVVELKRRRVGPSAASQLQRYVAAIEREDGDDAAVRGILVAPSVTDRARRLLAEHGLEFVAVEPPSSTGDAGGSTTLDTELSQTDAVDDSAHDPAGDATGDDDGEPARTLSADEESH
ncbi:endonuclease NucS [Halonotius pteroides]|uniref:Endonuclease NucS n=1 Tax=Halonotius pteroides TaxID=268735 RepID=A0A3A6Q4Y4_9EURY|nr:endonuclease NucS [Halonotius pteroides]RJX49482.1 endonuclease NucS [Halonotius pteroides]